MNIPLVLHVPHASIKIPEHVMDQFVITRKELESEIRVLTDHATDRIFRNAFPFATSVVFPVSRLVVDPERFINDSQEPMAETGMGVIYTHGTHRQRIRRDLTHMERRCLLRKYYCPHHEGLTRTVQRHLEKHGKCLVLDCHSFPAQALPYEQYPDARRPDFCLGTDDFHSPEGLVLNVETRLTRQGFEVARNEPFRGCLVPSRYCRSDRRVLALMIEINRSLYMDDDLSLCEPRLEQLIANLRGLRSSLVS
ncbi:MAG: N-formylglutamate amidohydrolase [Gammaproteobacteria bacterium]|nr:N-formylglutamate amidohydrolase [Gammaproteobacteria bacterium]